MLKNLPVIKVPAIIEAINVANKAGREVFRMPGFILVVSAELLKCLSDQMLLLLPKTGKIELGEMQIKI